MNLLKSIAAWLIAGAFFGVIFAATSTFLSCAPRLLWKPDLFSIFGIIFALEGSALGVATGTVVYIVFGRHTTRMRDFRANLLMAGIIALAILGIFPVAFLKSPPYPCAPP